MGCSNEAPPGRGGWRLFLRSLAPFSFLLLTACAPEWECRIPGACSDGDRDGPDLPGFAEVKDVEITPAVVYADWEVPFTVDARPLDDQGRVIAAPATPVTWYALPGFSVEGRGSEAIVSVEAPRPSDNREERWVADGVTVTAGSHSSSLRIIAADGSIRHCAYDRLVASFKSLPEDPSAEPEVLVTPRPVSFILDGKADGFFRKDLVFSVAGGGLLEWDFEPGCDPPDYAAVGDYGRGKRPATAPSGGIWATGPGGILEVKLERTPVLKLVLWKHAHRPPVGDEDPVLAAMEDDVKLAQEILNRSGVGVSLEVVERRSPTSPLNSAYYYDGSNCKALDGLTALVETEPVEGGIQRIYVVYLNDIRPYGRGGVCLWGEGRNSPVILVDYQKKAPTTLVHELGHLLALNDSTMPYAGHTSAVDGFDAGNVMWKSENPNSPSNRDRFTLGQVFRMNFDIRSWLEVVDPGRPTICCQASPYTDDPCPDLWRDVNAIPDPDNESTLFANRDCPWGERGTEPSPSDSDGSGRQ